MKVTVEREPLLTCLEQMRLTVGTNVLVPEYHRLNFYGNRVQTNDGASVMDAPLPQDVDIRASIEAEPFINLLRKAPDSTLDVEVTESEFIVTGARLSNTAVKCEPRIVSLQEYDTKVSVEDVPGFLKALSICRYAASRDQTKGSLCGVHVEGSYAWGCDRYRIIKWTLDTPTQMSVTVPTKLIDTLMKLQDQILGIDYIPRQETSGDIFVTLKNETFLWGLTLDGEYRDLDPFFPSSSGQHVVMGDSFPSILERHLDNLKDVPSIDKEMSIRVEGNSVITRSEKKTNAGGVLRAHEEDSDCETCQVEGGLAFLVNPSLLADAVGLAWAFEYHPDSSVVLFTGEGFKYLIMTRG